MLEREQLHKPWAVPLGNTLLWSVMWTARESSSNRKTKQAPTAIAGVPCGLNSKISDCSSQEVVVCCINSPKQRKLDWTFKLSHLWHINYRQIKLLSFKMGEEEYQNLNID